MLRYICPVRKKRNPKHKVVWMAVITAIMLVGVFSMQVYWLNVSYKEQQARFITSTNEALVETVIKIQISKLLTRPDMAHTDSLAAHAITEIATHTIAGGFAKGWALAGQEIPEQAIDTTITPSPQYIEGLDSMVNNREYVLHQMMKGEINLAFCVQTFKYALAGRAIDVPFELAVIDSNGILREATCDTNLFQKTPLKSMHSLPLLPGGSSLQAAFTDTNRYFVSNMTWPLSATLLVAVVCCVSFTYMILLFFRQRRLSEIRSAFLSNMAHELKTPISSVSVALEMIGDNRYPISEDVKKEYMEAMQSELKRLTLLVENVLQMASFEKNEINIHPVPFIAISWLQEVLNNMRAFFDARSARVVYSIKPELLVFHADKTHLTNVLHNLLENAIKYNDKESPLIDIRIFESTDNITIQVMDNGAGIPEVYAGKVFDHFFRVPTGERHDIKGYGLGLSYVKSVVALHHGTVSVTTKEKEGSVFTIQLPRKTPD